MKKGLLKKKLLRNVLKILHIFPIKNNKIVFICNRGLSYCCNPKYMAQYIHEKYKDEYDICFFYNKKELLDKVGVEWIIWHKFNSIDYLFDLATAKYIISNITVPEYFPYRKEQIKICTWHGSAFKAYDVRHSYDYNVFDVFFAENRLSFDAFRNEHNYKNILLQYGMPRNDVLINCSDFDKLNLKKKLKIKKNEKILMYAPTFRDNGEIDSFGIDFDKIKKLLEGKTGYKWRIMFRYHPLQQNRVLPIGCVDVTNYLDMQELLCISDILITDYSSCMWDFSLTGRPCIIYATDLERYVTEERGVFLYPLDSMPFPIAKNNDELLNIINCFDEEKYSKELMEFHSKWGRYNYKADSTQRNLEYIFNLGGKRK